MQSGIGDRITGNPLISDHRFDVVMRVNKVDPKHGAFIAPIINEHASQPHPGRNRIFFAVIRPVKPRVNGPGRNNQGVLAVRHYGLNPVFGIFPKSRKITGSIGRGLNQSGRRRVYKSFEKRSVFGRVRGGRKDCSQYSREKFGGCHDVVSESRSNVWVSIRETVGTGKKQFSRNFLIF
ncbi:hypothetical protein EVA_09334 [gut metagenome]|uniref:Uncharacterized protein n=1 Tax=gut metagenome TaxID=749906 RepID=J9G6T8_9ZZZZ